MESTPRPFPTEAFEDVLAANHRYSRFFAQRHLTGTAARGLALVTCMDSRIDPLAIVGMRAGDAKILRNAGGRVTEDVLRTLVLATHLLGVRRVLVMPHTDCRMACEAEEIHAQLLASSGIDTRGLQILTAQDQLAALRDDLADIRAYPYLPGDLVSAGAIYDVRTGLLEPIGPT